MPRCQAQARGQAKRADARSILGFRSGLTHFSAISRLAFAALPSATAPTSSSTQLRTVDRESWPRDEPLCFDVHDWLTLLDGGETLEASRGRAGGAVGAPGLAQWRLVLASRVGAHDSSRAAFHMSARIMLSGVCPVIEEVLRPETRGRTAVSVSMIVRFPRGRSAAVRGVSTG